MSQQSIINDIRFERTKQDEKWGEQNHPSIEWMAILMEEVGEASKESLEAHFTGKSEDRYSKHLKLRKELIQVAAVAVSMIESLDRNELK